MPPSTAPILTVAGLALLLVCALALIPLEALAQAGKILLAWSLASTLLVAGLGAWVAWRRIARERAWAASPRRRAARG